MNVEAVIKEAYENAIEKGFHDGRDNIHEKIMLIISEIGEALEADRDGNRADFEDLEVCQNSIIKSGMTEESSRITAFKNTIKDTFEDELADVFIRLADLAGYMKVEADWSLVSVDRFKNIPENTGEQLLLLTKTVCGIKEGLGPGLKYVFIDAMSFLLLIAKYHNVDIEKHIELKMEYNKSRPALHGKKY